MRISMSLVEKNWWVEFGLGFDWGQIHACWNDSMVSLKRDYNPVVEGGIDV